MWKTGIWRLWLRITLLLKNMTHNEENLLTINPIGKIIGPDGKEYTCAGVIAEIAAIEREIEKLNNTIKAFRYNVRTKIEKETQTYLSIFQGEHEFVIQ